MKRRLVLILSLVLIAMALVLPTGTVCAFGFCTSCTESCRNEAFSLEMQCRSNGGSVSYCEGQAEQYNQSCQTLFCDGCPFLPY